MLTRREDASTGSVAEGGRSIYPEGTFRVSLLAPKEPTKETEAGAWRAGEPAFPLEKTNVWFGRGEPANEDSPDPGNMYFFWGFYSAENGVSLLDFDGSEEPPLEMLGKHYGRFEALAIALGAVDRTEDMVDGELTTFVTPRESFLADLQAGAFVDAQVLITVRHMERTNNKDEKETIAYITKVLPE